jgi:RNA polymerase sigma-70 factor, ECF subfamily
MTSARLPTISSHRVSIAVEASAMPGLMAGAAGAMPSPRAAGLVLRRTIGRMTDETDETLMGQVAAGDQAAFRLLMDRHIQRSMRLAQRVSGNASDAEEVVQEAFLRLWTKADTWQEGRGRFTTWFFRIVMNLCLDRKRRQPFLPLDAVAEPADQRRNAVEGIYERQVNRQVTDAIAELPERQRAALVMCYYEEMSNIEAAAALSVSVSALEALLVRARRALKIKLASLGALGSKEEG